MISWSGIFHILATPFTEDGALDTAGLPHLVGRALARIIHEWASGDRAGGAGCGSRGVGGVICKMSIVKMSRRSAIAVMKTTEAWARRKTSMSRFSSGVSPSGSGAGACASATAGKSP